ncbi:MAG: tetratricopeptide repeat protein [Verrucomicrobia bacterium]|nr:tetratricopeptide repeat protein [Verrucomicrobiota bacterium]
MVWTAASALAGMLCAQPHSLFAHGDTHEQIEKLTRQIVASPQDAALHVKRGELHRLHRDWNAAQADFDRAAQLDPELPLLDLLGGRLLLEMDQAADAKLHLDRFLATRPQHVEALVTRARVFTKLRDVVSAAKDFSAAIALSPEPKPEYFLERAQALRTDNAHFAEALRGLNEGVQQFGPLVTLETLAIELELETGNYDGALARVERLAAQSPRQESWLARRGEILLQAGRATEARAAFAQALTTVDTLSVSQRKTEAILQLEIRLRARLQVLTNSALHARIPSAADSRLVKSGETPAPSVDE